MSGEQSSRPLIAARGISKAFPPTIALDGVDFALAPGEIHSLAGENGSGKSTLLKVLSGALAPDEGEVIIGDHRLALGDVHAAMAAGIALVTQEGSLLPELSVAENVMLGQRHIRRGGFIDWAATRRKARAVLDLLGLDLDPAAAVSSLPTDRRQMVEIARAVSADAQVLLLDEPTSSLDLNEVGDLFGLLRRLRGEGVGIVFVSHRMSEMTAISDRVTVLRDGRCVGDARMAEVDHAWLVRRMVGRDLTTFPTRTPRPLGQTVLSVEDLCDAERRVKQASLSVRAGEIVGLAGLVGAGRTELLETIIGARRRIAGSVHVAGQRLTGGPRAALAAGVTMVSEDRKATGAVPEMSLADNMLLSGRQPALRLRRPGAEARTLAPWMDQLRVRGGSLGDPIGRLSGGNQQKVLLGRSLVTEPTVLLLDEPTRGVDIGAKMEIGALIGQIAGGGAGILLASSELPEILAICHRVLVMRGGAIVAEFDREDMTEERIVREAIGAETVNA